MSIKGPPSRRLSGFRGEKQPSEWLPPPSPILVGMPRVLFSGIAEDIYTTWNNDRANWCSSWKSNSKPQVLVSFSTRLYSRFCKWALKILDARTITQTTTTTLRKRLQKCVIPDEYQITILNNVIIFCVTLKNNINKSKFLPLHWDDEARPSDLN